MKHIEIIGCEGAGKTYLAGKIFAHKELLDNRFVNLNEARDIVSYKILKDMNINRIYEYCISRSKFVSKAYTYKYYRKEKKQLLWENRNYWKNYFSSIFNTSFNVEDISLLYFRYRWVGDKIELYESLNKYLIDKVLLDDSMIIHKTADLIMTLKEKDIYRYCNTIIVNTPYPNAIIYIDYDSNTIKNHFVSRENAYLLKKSYRYTGKKIEDKIIIEKYIYDSIYKRAIKLGVPVYRIIDRDDIDIYSIAKFINKVC